MAIGGPDRYRIEDPNGVFDYLNDNASDLSKWDFYNRLAEIAEEPLPGDGDVFPLRDEDKPNTFTASFGDGFIVYQVMADHPVIFLVDVFLL